jgi:hypothetical protein
VNGLLGMARPAGVADQFDRARDWVGTTERGKVTPLAPSSDRLAWGMTSNHGTVVGRARDGELGLAYVGSFHQPFPDWGEGSPLDDPNRTAAVLLERFRRLGRDFLDGLCGHFAVAVTEPGTDRVLLARAPGGSIRWFFAEHDGALLFSTRLADMAGLLGTSLIGGLPAGLRVPAPRPHALPRCARARTGADDRVEARGVGTPLVARPEPLGRPIRPG